MLHQPISHRLSCWLEYQKVAQSRYYLHSPFVYDFYCQVLDKANDGSCLAIENRWIQAKKDNHALNIEDFGSKPGNYSKTVGYLAKRAAIQPKYGKVLHHIIKWQGATYVLELGTSLGFSSAYIASAHSGVELTTIDGSSNVQSYAKMMHRELGITNVTYVCAKFDDILESTIKDFPRLDFVYIDGNHTFEATMQYFKWLLPLCRPKTILVFDDIYWSKSMTQAWKEIKLHKQVKLTIDIFQLGIVCFNDEKLAKEDFVLRY